MIVDTRTIVELFRKVNEFRKAMSAKGFDPEKTPVSVKEIKETAEEYLGISIKISSVVFEGTYLHSAVFRFDKHADVLIRSDISEPMQRFAAIKEICHLVMDPEESWTTDIPDSVKKLLEQPSFVEVDHSTTAESIEETDKVVIVENIAELAATEILYPPERRDNDRIQLDACEMSYRRLAAEMNITIRCARWVHLRWYKKLKATSVEEAALKVE